MKTAAGKLKPRERKNEPLCVCVGMSPRSSWGPVGLAGKIKPRRESGNPWYHAARVRGRLIRRVLLRLVRVGLLPTNLLVRGRELFHELDQGALLRIGVCVVHRRSGQ